MDASASRWQHLLSELQKELEQMNANLRSLELENLRMREVVEHRPPLDLSRPLSLSSPSQSLSAVSKADRSWSLALNSVTISKSTRPSKEADQRAQRIFKSVSFEAEPNTDETVVESGSISTLHSFDKARDAPVRGILKKEATYRVSIAPENELSRWNSVNSIRKAKTTKATHIGSPTASATASAMTKRSFLEEDRTQFAIIRGQKTRVFMMQKPWYVINPDSNIAANIWQGITTLALVWVALVTPLQVGLLKLQVDWIFLTSLVVDLIFLIDMVLQFFTTYVRRTPRGDEWEVRMVSIILHYLRTWFFLDFITLIPFELLTLGSGSGAFEELTFIKVIRVLRLLKLTRLMRSSRLAQRLEAPISLPYQHLALMRCVLVLILVCHWFAALWAMTIDLVPDGTPTWLDEIAAVDETFGVITREEPFRIYVASYYFCSYTMTSVGYGDIGPANALERIVCTVLVMTAGLCWACVLGEVCAIVAEMNAETQDFRKKMHHLNRMMTNQGLPSELRLRLRSFFLQNKHQAVFATHQRLLLGMSPQLRAEVCTAVNLPWLRKVPFFNNFLMHIEALELAGMDTGSLQSCIADISQELELAAYAQRESFNNVQVLHILAKGLVVLNTRVAYNGAVWGEDFVLADIPLIQKVSGFALTYVEVLCLKRENFMRVIERRRTLCPQLGQIVRRYCVRIAVYRGILAEARRLALKKIAEEEVRMQPPESVQITPLPGMVDLDD